ncbi:radical SAM family heme chaperone HemW [Phaeovibrio sulfidiphilus]|uniref:Heme chaperone HemW n=1 Tax=Phaeovibrio sulfidiphilus TaxID=1220600 RepID=A0A8J7CVD7_9PROT|nr:radical SAM family heme chaperone HemW [Phaeovibrio sulfidiphilus]MBE1236181.1 radical SAM family heme chaperone HemW [Phaeovibrio sulfidiphilus]
MDHVAGDGDFALYVHWPFCRSKCPYCDFNSTATSGVDDALWEKAYLSDLERQAARLSDRSRVLSSIYFGGGTPSLMAPSTVRGIVDRARALWDTSPDVEITLELNPSGITERDLAAFREAGINRLSVGIQSLDDGALKVLGRRHNAREGVEVYRTARTLFDRVSLDLIYARPHQTLAAWEEELEAVLDLEPTHISAYQLSLEPGTPLFSALVSEDGGMPEEDLATDLFLATKEGLESVGLTSYEVSSHARPGFECRHNLATWRGGNYLGLGPGAHGRLPVQDGTLATVSLCDSSTWLRRVTAGEDTFEVATLLDRRERALEMVLTGLRLREGVSESRVKARTGFEFADLLDTDALTMAVELGLVRLGADALRATRDGELVLNAVTTSLMAL